MAQDIQTSSGIGFCGLLAIVFITLKLVGVITWSWWWVLAPLWIGFVVFLVLIIVIFFGLVVVALATHIRR